MADKIRRDIGKRLQDGRQLHRKKFLELEQAKLGNLRAGNSGLMSEDGVIAGSCHRVAHLRQLGLELDPPTDSRLIMFQLGIANEDEVYDDLVHTATEAEVIKREEEIPIEWKTSNGTKVTGRPDLVICTELKQADERSGAATSLQPLLGLELKSIASVWTTREVLVEGNPKLAHLVQSGHYMWKLGVPFRLVYKQYGLQAFPDFAKRMLPRKGAAGSEFLEYNDSDEPKNFVPFEVIYELEYRNGCLQFRPEGRKQWNKTIVSIEDINRFYEFVSTMGERKLLGPKPQTVDHSGNDKSYSNCKYCKLQSVCKRVDVRGKAASPLSYDQWLKEVRNVLDKNK